MNKDKMYKRRTEALKTVNVKCECGHSINITNRYKRIVCSWCGKMVYLNEDDKKKNDFKSKVRNILNENSKVNNITF